MLTLAIVQDAPPLPLWGIAALLFIFACILAYRIGAARMQRAIAAKEVELVRSKECKCVDDLIYKLVHLRQIYENCPIGIEDECDKRIIWNITEVRHADGEIVLVSGCADIAEEGE